MNDLSRNSLLDFFAETSFLNTGSAPYIEFLAEKYERDPASLPQQWRAALGDIVTRPPPSFPQESTVSTAETGIRAIKDAVGALALVQAFRMRGHFDASLDPLGLRSEPPPVELDHRAHGFSDADLDRTMFVDGVLGHEKTTLRKLQAALRERYCGTIGYEYMHIADHEQRQWLQQKIEGDAPIGRLSDDERMDVLEKLVEVKGYERYLDKKFVGTTRFGLDGAEATIPALEAIIQLASHHGVTDVVLGMAHRGRLNVLSQVLRKPHRAIFHEFKGGSFLPDDVEGSGDVKYHLGASADREFDGRKVHLSLLANPSHLEIVDPVVLGKVRAKQDHRADHAEQSSILPLLIHGDAAFAGQGVVAECFAFSGLEGYRTSGSVHFIVNNQIGFTTDPGYSRSSPYPSDLAKMVDAPIFHVNGDDPEAVVAVSRLALEYRQAFGKPVVIDMVCFRFYGHNEGDEPAFTQPLMYKAIRSHASTLEIYADRLRAEGVVTAEALDGMKARWQAHLDTEFEASQNFRPDKADWLGGRWQGLRSSRGAPGEGKTAVEPEILSLVGAALTRVPDGFTVHPTVRRFLDARGKTITDGSSIDWSTAEALALGTLVNEGTSVRMTGQDTERGTFSQRHAVLNDQVTGKRCLPITSIAGNGASFDIFNSLLSEEAVVAFEYGYTLAEPHALVVWEAQFGDFANGAQVVFDQFLSSGERKWLRMSGLVCLLPHGFDGQGPEHSSARLERYLQSSAENNWQVANCTTPANYFHILRRQVRRDFRKPLILMTPKSLLRHRRCRSAFDELSTGTSFQPVLRDDADVAGRTLELLPDAKIRRVIACSGKVYFDLLDEREKLERRDVYLIRIEQLYPFPVDEFTRELARFPGAELIWCQEEPRNMGAWTYIEPLVREAQLAIRSEAAPPRYAGRDSSSSPAVGLPAQHQEQLARFLAEAFA
ncbi:2-oxoglutarate dehydrogenase E1 component [Rhodanobacter sp. Col0626]|uniref:2-oxoglutarate dehydrogenase E1 component n=1 Tax=Rhodanobacter sp. Col0626 TaxID=3415679 RepID=UPI003CE81939